MNNVRNKSKDLRRNPTFKQKEAFKKMVENGGNVSKAMRNVGYSEAMAKNPQKLTKSKGWQELMNRYLPDEHLVKKHRALLDKDEPHAIKGALDLAYKLKGYYKPEKHVNLDLNLDLKMDKETLKIKEEYERKLFDQLTK